MESFLRKILEQDIKDNSMTKDKKKRRYFYVYLINAYV